MNWVDLVVLVIFLVVFTLGFFGGLGRALAAIIAVFVGLVSAGVFYRALGSAISGLFSTIPDWVAQLVGFFIVAIVIGAAALYALIWSFRITPLRTRRVLELRGGFPAVLFVALLSVVLAIGVITPLAQVTDWSARQIPVSGTSVTVRRELDESVLMTQALRLAPYLYDGVGSWIPGSPPTILRPAQG